MSIAYMVKIQQPRIKVDKLQTLYHLERRDAHQYPPQQYPIDLIQRWHLGLRAGGGDEARADVGRRRRDGPGEGERLGGGRQTPRKEMSGEGPLAARRVRCPAGSATACNQHEKVEGTEKMAV
jgi:hypothetical protein